VSANLKVYFSMTMVKDGKLLPPYGNLNAPIADVDITGDSFDFLSDIVVPAGETKVLWQYGIHHDFEVAVFTILDSGYGYLCWLVDRPTSATDSTATGAVRRWREVDVTCKVPFLLNSDAARINATAASDYGDDASSLPKILSATDSEVGKVYEVVMLNPGTDDITVRRAIIN